MFIVNDTSPKQRDAAASPQGVDAESDSAIRREEILAVARSKVRSVCTGGQVKRALALQAGVLGG